MTVTCADGVHGGPVIRVTDAACDGDCGTQFLFAMVHQEDVRTIPFMAFAACFANVKADCGTCGGQIRIATEPVSEEPRG